MSTGLDRTSGYHLFLVPEEGEGRRILSEAIHDLSRTHGGPIFEPHLTIAPEISAPASEVEVFAHTLAERPAPQVVLKGVETKESFFKCCYLAVEPSPELLAFYQDACERFGLTHTFNPHVSLAYGLYPIATLHALKEAAERALAKLPNPVRFTALEVWETEGAVADWKKVAHYELAAY